MKYILMTLAVIALTISMTFADQGVYGICYDIDSDTTIAGAKVKLVCLEVEWADSTTSLLMGNYSIRAPYVGGYMIRATKTEGHDFWDSGNQYVYIPFDTMVEKDLYLIKQ